MSHKFKPVWICATDCSDNDFHMSHEAICCSNLSRRRVSDLSHRVSRPLQVQSSPRNTACQGWGDKCIKSICSRMHPPPHGVWMVSISYGNVSTMSVFMAKRKPNPDQQLGWYIWMNDSLNFFFHHLSLKFQGKRVSNQNWLTKSLSFGIWIAWLADYMNWNRSDIQLKNVGL